MQSFCARARLRGIAALCCAAAAAGAAQGAPAAEISSWTNLHRAESGGGFVTSSLRRELLISGSSSGALLGVTVRSTMHSAMPRQVATRRDASARMEIWRNFGRRGAMECAASLHHLPGAGSSARTFDANCSAWATPLSRLPHLHLALAGFSTRYRSAWVDSDSWQLQPALAFRGPGGALIEVGPVLGNGKQQYRGFWDVFGARQTQGLRAAWNERTPRFDLAFELSASRTRYARWQRSRVRALSVSLHPSDESRRRGVSHFALDLRLIRQEVRVPWASSSETHASLSLQTTFGATPRR